MPLDQQYVSLELREADSSFARLAQEACNTQEALCLMIALLTVEQIFQNLRVSSHGITIVKYSNSPLRRNANFSTL